MASFIVLDPVAVSGEVQRIGTAGPERVTGLRIGVMDNTKPNAVEIMERAAQVLVAEHGAASVQVYRKLSASQGASPALLDQIAEETDLMITGSGDCGGCTSWSALDAVEMERRGVPAVLMVTDSFMPLATMLVEQEGATDMVITEIPHPIGGRPTDQVLPLGTDMAQDIVRMLRTGKGASDERT